MSATRDHAADVTVASGAILQRLDTIAGLLRDQLLDSEQEPDYDQSFVIVGNPAAAAAGKISLPRTIRHAEIAFQAQVAPVVPCALFDGNPTAADCASQFATNTGTVSGSSAIAASIGSTVTVRDYLTGSGILTVFFSAATVGACIVRVRSLDALQMRPQRT